MTAAREPFGPWRETTSARMVHVTYWHEGMQRVADCGPFVNPAHLAQWLEWCDKEAPFGNDVSLINMDIRYLVPPAPPKVPGKRTAKKVAAKS